MGVGICDGHSFSDPWASLSSLIIWRICFVFSDFMLEKITFEELVFNCVECASDPLESSRRLAKFPVEYGLRTRPKVEEEWIRIGRHC